MKITRIRVYRKSLTHDRGSYAWGSGKVIKENSAPMYRPAPHTAGGRLHASDAPVPGVEPDYDSIGDSVAVYA